MESSQTVVLGFDYENNVHRAQNRVFISGDVIDSFLFCESKELFLFAIDELKK